MKIIKLAIPTRGEGGLDDVVSNVFGRAQTFTIIEIKKDTIVKVNVIQNPAVSYKHGAGPIAVKMLTDFGVNTVAAGELGAGALTLLEQFNIIRVRVKQGNNVANAIALAIKRIPQLRRNKML